MRPGARYKLGRKRRDFRLGAEADGMLMALVEYSGRSITEEIRDMIMERYVNMFADTPGLDSPGEGDD